MSDTPVQVEDIKLTIIVGSGPTTFEEPIKHALCKIADIQGRGPNPPAVSIEIDVTTPKDKMETRAFIHVQTTIRDLLLKISEIKTIVLYSLHLTRNHKTNKTDCPQQDRTHMKFLRHLIKMGKENKVPYLNLGVTADVDDEYAWGVLTTAAKDLNNSLHMPSLKGVCLVLQFRDVPGIGMYNLPYNLVFRRSRLLARLRELQEGKKNLVVRYYVGMSFGGKFIGMKCGVRRLKKLRA
ncbi:hypothetical protein CVT24_001235 [Panaeolus cyanescens]|uniref:Uncharacterized protein n=1 Tax=Panaeolus cyanescens TaxID=181874 RepID=A0A409YYX0_9AGAR|nr:hypothetical protein CVT24_001235 [Panaeolus cyanescens]